MKLFSRHDADKQSYKISLQGLKNRRSKHYTSLAVTTNPRQPHDTPTRNRRQTPVPEDHGNAGFWRVRHEIWYRIFPTRFLRITLEGHIQGKKVYGRPRTMFLDWLLKTDEGTKEERKMLAQDRSRWSQWRWKPAIWQNTVESFQ